MKRKLRIAMIAPPWLTIPPKGYGGTENVIDGLVRGLVKAGMEVELFSTGRSGIRAAKHHLTYKIELYEHIYRPYYETTSIAAGQVLHALSTIAQDGKFDIIHDHNQFIGPAILEWAAKVPGMPPAIHTMHGPPFTTRDMIKSGRPDNTPVWRQLTGDRFHVVGISKAMMRQAPRALKKAALDPVHNGIDLKAFPFQKQKQDYFLTLARFSKQKGQHLAAEIAEEEGYSLKMAGSVAGITNPRKLLLELGNPSSEYRQYPNFQYYSDKIFPIVADNHNIVYSGDLTGKRKINTLAGAKALLFPIDWEEPFGMSVIEALACGTPVVAMNRGALPEIIEHGKTGFLASTKAEFKKYMGMVDEIDPKACRKSVEDRFSNMTMADTYIQRYRRVLELAEAKK